jgi:hypothetical protein
MPLANRLLLVLAQYTPPVKCLMAQRPTTSSRARDAVRPRLAPPRTHGRLGLPHEFSPPRIFQSHQPKLSLKTTTPLQKVVGLRRIERNRIPMLLILSPCSRIHSSTARQPTYRCKSNQSLLLRSRAVRLRPFPRMFWQAFQITILMILN